LWDFFFEKSYCNYGANGYIFIALFIIQIIMEIAVKAEKKWFSAHIPELHISTQWDTFDKLVKNIQEALELYYEEEKKYRKDVLNSSKFYFNMENLKHAVNRQIAS
jgi:predicted RNase H-like HicB family nuclease